MALFVPLLACAGPKATSRSAEPSAPSQLAELPVEVRNTLAPELRPKVELESRYALALEMFDRGAYRDAADLFARVFLDVPPDPSGDALRHLLIQHVGWSLLGVHDMNAEPDALDRGEAMLERYLAKHESLRPLADGERTDIYMLLGEYSLRREGQPPPDANAQLRSLARATQRHIATHEVERRVATRDTMVRTIEVDTIEWADPDDPRVRSFHADPRYTGPSLFERAPEPFHPTRVLVRGWVGSNPGPARPGPGLAYALLADARPALERCYEGALIRGADILERATLDLHFDSSGQLEARFDDQTLDPETTRCVVSALEGVESERKPKAPRTARLHLSFFVQSARYPTQADVDQGYGGTSGPFQRGPITGGPIVQGAAIEDVSFQRPPPRPQAVPQ